MWSRVFFLCALLAVNHRRCLAYNRESVEVNSDTLRFRTGHLNITREGNQLYLNIWKSDGSSLRSTLLSETNATPVQEIIVQKNCPSYGSCVLAVDNNNGHKIEIRAGGENLYIKHTDLSNNQIRTCYEFNNDTEWFAGPEKKDQYWPIQHGRYEKQPLVSSHVENMAVVERYWVSSKGMYIKLNRFDPVFADQNNLMSRHLCLFAENVKPYHPRDELEFSYEIGVYEDPRKAHESMIRYHYGRPSGYPDTRMAKYPIWSTWARYKTKIDDKIVREFADEILEYGFENSQIEIDDNWEDCYGSASFDKKKFPDVEKLVSDLKAKGFRVTLWIHPFINRYCRNNTAYFYAKKNGYFVTNLQGSDHTKWWEGPLSAGIVDFSNDDAVEWWVGRLKEIEKLGFDGFKFDAGESSWLPEIANLNGPEYWQPGLYTYNYTTTLERYFNNMLEVRVASGTQRLPIYIRMDDKDSTWTWNNGLPTVITTLLQMNLNGYSFVLPDMIGGNGYGDTKPSKEMFIRWLQVNVFMPSLQFSYVPWDYDNETVAISKKFTKLHAEIAPLIIELMKKIVETGAPINPPIWWVDPLNVDAHKVNDEFLLGESVLIAPVTKEGAVERDIYLPRGVWQDANYETVHVGPTWLRNYPAPIQILPYFFKLL